MASRPARMSLVSIATRAGRRSAARRRTHHDELEGCPGLNLGLAIGTRLDEHGHYFSKHSDSWSSHHEAGPGARQRARLGLELRHRGIGGRELGLGVMR